MLSPLVCGAEVSARLDRQSIGIDETVRLFIEADGAQNTISDINTSALERDFTILNRSSSSNFQLSNGSAKATKLWTLEIEAKQVGNFTIAPFTVGNEKSNPLTLKVTKSIPTTAPNDQITKDVFLEVSPQMDSPAYIQGQITINVKLFIRSQLRIGEASLEEPEIEHAIVRKLGDDCNYQVKKNGVNFQVIERKYAIIAEEGNEVIIPPLRFQAINLDGSSRRRFAGDPFFSRFSNQGQRLRAKSQELKIALTPIPTKFNGKIWLPAHEVAVMENQNEIVKLKVGEPLTRTIQIEALGLTAEQLPKIEVEAPEGSKIYLDQPELQTSVDGSLLHALKRQSLAFIPSQPGTFTLPAINIKWWDVVNSRQRQASLPELVIKVVNNEPQALATTSANNQQDAPKEDHTQAETTDYRRPASPLGTSQPWQIASAILLLIWVITLLLWHRSLRRLPQNKKTPMSADTTRPTANRKAIQNACLNNSPQATQQAILDWAIATWQQESPTNLKTVAQKLKNPDLEKIFAELEQALYSPDDNLIWSGEKAWSELSTRLKVDPQSSSKPKKDELPPLYS